MSDLYIKNSKGEFIPVEINKVVGDDWDGKVICVRLGSETVPAGGDEEGDMYKALRNADALADSNVTFLITSYEVGFEVLGNSKELLDKCILVKVNSGENLSPFGESLQRKAKKLLRENKVGNKSVTLPAPLTVKEYKDVMEIKRRCDIRRNRRG